MLEIKLNFLKNLYEVKSIVLACLTNIQCTSQSNLLSFSAKYSWTLISREKFTVEDFWKRESETCSVKTRLHQASASTLFSIKPISIASSQRSLWVETYAWCKQGLSLYIKSLLLVNSAVLSDILGLCLFNVH